MEEVATLSSNGQALGRGDRIVVTSGLYVGDYGQVVKPTPAGREPSGLWVYLVRAGLCLLDSGTLDADSSTSA